MSKNKKKNKYTKTHNYQHFITNQKMKNAFCVEQNFYVWEL